MTTTTGTKWTLAIVALATLGFAAPTCSRETSEASVPHGAASFDVALIGDQQYRPATETEFERMMDAVDTARVAFVVHVGDIKSGATPCTDSLLTARRDRFNRSAHPFVFLYGDNEWADCYTSNYDPLERLARLRTLFSAGDRSLGRETIALERQSSDPQFADYRENVRWERGGVLFMGINVPGTSQTHRRTAPEQQEYERRMAADVAWMRAGFARAAERKLAGVMVLTQANPMFDRSVLRPAARARFAEHDPIIETLRTETVAFGKPVLFVHGDYHMLLIDKPLRDAADRPIENFTRLMVYGDPYSHWVRATVDSADPAVFRLTPTLVPGNTVPR
jgi:hypothetical protein